MPKSVDVLGRAGAPDWTCRGPTFVHCVVGWLDGGTVLKLEMRLCALELLCGGGVPDRPEGCASSGGTASSTVDAVDIVLLCGPCLVPGLGTPPLGLVDLEVHLWGHSAHHSAAMVCHYWK